MALPCLPRLAPGVGLCRPVLIVRDLVLHMPSRRCIDPKRGIVYGALGTPIGHTCADGGNLAWLHFGRLYCLVHRL